MSLITAVNNCYTAEITSEVPKKAEEASERELKIEVIKFNSVAH
jgi:hypothetical protein